LNGNDSTREIDSNGRVREFVRHVCGDYSDVVPGLDAEQNAVFLFPRWPSRRTFGSKIGQESKAPTTGVESSTLIAKETTEFILGAEETLVKNLRRAIADAHRKATVQTAQTPAPRSADVHATAPRSAEPVHGVRSRTATARIALDPIRQHRQACIFAAIRERVKGLAYCESLARKQLRVSTVWRASGCPKEYPDAYLKKKWRKLINQEKSRHGAQLAILDRTSPGEVDKIIRLVVRPLIPAGAA
jgi:hypothetical protein